MSFSCKCTTGGKFFNHVQCKIHKTKRDCEMTEILFIAKMLSSDRKTLHVELDRNSRCTMDPWKHNQVDNGENIFLINHFRKHDEQKLD